MWIKPQGSRCGTSLRPWRRSARPRRGRRAARPRPRRALDLLRRHRRGRRHRSRCAASAACPSSAMPHRRCWAHRRPVSQPRPPSRRATPPQAAWRALLQAGAQASPQIRRRRESHRSGSQAGVGRRSSRSAARGGCRRRQHRRPCASRGCFSRRARTVCGSPATFQPTRTTCSTPRRREGRLSVASTLAVPGQVSSAASLKRRNWSASAQAH